MFGSFIGTAFVGFLTFWFINIFSYAFSGGTELGAIHSAVAIVGAIVVMSVMWIIILLHKIIAEQKKDRQIDHRNHE